MNSKLPIYEWTIYFIDRAESGAETQHFKNYHAGICKALSQNAMPNATLAEQFKQQGRKIYNLLELM